MLGVIFRGTRCEILGLDIFWLKDDSLTDASALPPPEVLAAQIAADLRAVQATFAGIAERLAERR